MLRVLPPTFKPINNLICCKTGLIWVVMRAISLFNSFWSVFAWQNAWFLWPIYPYHKTRCLRRFAKNNRYHSAMIWNIPFSLMVNIFTKVALNGPYFSKKMASSQKKKILISFDRNFCYSFYWFNKYARKISEKSSEQKSVTRKVVQNSAVRLSWNFKNKLLWDRTSHQLEFFEAYE